MWYLWISTEFYHRHILYKSMSIDLHSLDIGGQPRNRVHRSPIRILISKEKKRKRDSIARHRTNFSISSILQSIASTPTNPPHLFLHEKTLRAWTTMDHFPFWLTVARGGIARLLLARRKREENSTSSCFLFLPVSTTFLNPGWIPLPSPPRYLKLGGSIRCSTGWKIVSIDLHSSVFWRYTIVGIVGGTWIKYRHKILPLAWKINLNRNSLHLIEIVPFRQNCSIIVYKIE